MPARTRGSARSAPAGERAPERGAGERRAAPLALGPRRRRASPRAVFGGQSSGQRTRRQAGVSPTRGAPLDLGHPGLAPAASPDHEPVRPRGGEDRAERGPGAAQGACAERRARRRSTARYGVRASRGRRRAERRAAASRGRTVPIRRFGHRTATRLDRACSARTTQARSARSPRRSRCSASAGRSSSSATRSSACAATATGSRGSTSRGRCCPTGCAASSRTGCSSSRDDPERAGRQLYELTAAGEELWPALHALIAWGARHRRPSTNRLPPRGVRDRARRRARRARRAASCRAAAMSSSCRAAGGTGGRTDPVSAMRAAPRRLLEPLVDARRPRRDARGGVVHAGA